MQGGAANWDPKPLTEAVSGLVAVWHVPADHDAPLLVAGASDPGGGTAFEQVNSEAAALLSAHVLEVAQAGVQASNAERLHAIDAYCGVGAYGHAVRAATTDAPDGFEAIVDSVEDRLAELLPADLLVLNPPRSGLHAHVPEIIAANGPDALIYVSCDSATLARDLRGLNGTYDLVSVRCFDLFPQTAHVESVVALARKETAS